MVTFIKCINIGAGANINIAYMQVHA